jgi:hypothetical protein
MVAAGAAGKIAAMPTEPMYTTTAEPAKIRELPADEHAKMLDARYQEAQARVSEGQQLVREWQPVAASCLSGLEALKEAQDAASRGQG